MSADSRRVKTRSALLLPLAVLLFATPAVAAPDIYPAPEQAPADVAAAVQTAAATHRRVILDFGGNWCPDCRVLDTYFHDAANAPLLEAGFVLVHVNVGRLDQNLDLAERYEVPLKKGVPALAVLDAEGKRLYSQQTGEFEAMRKMQSSAVTDFLTQWKPAPAQ
ncbi:MAG: thioredoxin family protein [Gluconacetobacter diazotrophicus]|nr:thioredoxin family protein [Gluconacetobacter diazotrophicus]